MSDKQENMFTRKDTGRQYLAFRTTYPQALYDEILAFHDKASSGRAFCVDIGCGPGIVTKAVAPSFEQVLGIDPSESMIEAARETLPNELKSKVTYEIGSAEDLKSVSDSCVDLVIGGTMAHWLQPEPWYKEMARILKPGGTIAVFTYAWPMPAKETKNYAQLQPMIDQLVNKVKDVGQKGNLIAKSLYEQLARPEDFASTAAAFEPSVYKAWKSQDQSPPYFCAQTSTFADFMSSLATGGPIVKWKETDPEAANAYLEKVKQKFSEIAELSDEDEVTVVRSIGLVMIKRK